MSLRDSARRALGDDPITVPSITLPDAPRGGKARTTDRFSIPPEATRESSVERVSLDVRVEGRVEQVTLVLRDGELAWSCTDGSAGRESSGAPSSPWVRAALRWVLAEARPEPQVARPLRPVPSAAGDELVDRGRRLADALDDVVLAVVRAGITGRDSPSVREALDRVARGMVPVPNPVSRWIGRLERAMGAGDARTVARLLDGATRAGDDLRGARTGPIGRARAAAWLGAHGPSELERVVDRAMIELARESLDGIQRAAIERRYLLDLATGEVLCEERARSATPPSLGPCPRSLFVGLAEIEEGPAPRRVRILQYTVAIDVQPSELEKALAHAVRRASMLVDVYREALAASPALAEPVQLIGCTGVEDGFLVDAVGEPIPIARDEDPGAAAALDLLAKERPPAWIVGRLVDLEGAVRVVPCACGDASSVARLR
ncbi:hypothetical protein [Sandaracinus amylolyticus]|uniref:Uncharacterized protein n=1 Tax=Sandaracinus amylolyticus TaxID=927083 RepID=A0A0F6W463_9BACT|nr:hypothetical protein [Sandaracinus amylolyticus]AKF06961.1 hypothetical protein DB32_004110 [Sandaracinus amylolyticus]